MPPAIPPMPVPPGGAPPAMGLPQLPYAADTGSLTGWLLDSTATKLLDSISRGLLTLASLDWYPAFQSMVTRSCESYAKYGRGDYSLRYPNYVSVATNFGSNAVEIMVVHYIARYSTGSGVSNSLHSQTLGLLGETRGAQLPMF
jgi:hypothetical protein